MPKTMKRVNLTLDEDIHAEAQRLAGALNISLSAMTRLLYVLALSGERVLKDLRDHLMTIEDMYPDGVPEDQAEEFIRSFFQQYVGLVNRWTLYIEGLMAGADVPGVKVGPTKELTMPQLGKIFTEMADAAPGLRRLSAAIEDPSGPRSPQPSLGL